MAGIRDLWDLLAPVAPERVRNWGEAISDAADSGTNEAVAATPDTLALRDASGRTQFAEPDADADAATKKYVDDNAGGGGGSRPIPASSTVQHLTLPGYQFQGSYGTQGTNGWTYYFPMSLSRTLSLVSLQGQVTSENGRTVSLSVHTSDDNMQPNGLVVDLGTILVDSTGTKTVLADPPVSLDAGNYLIRVAHSGGGTAWGCHITTSPSVPSMGTGSSAANFLYRTGYSATASDPGDPWTNALQGSSGMFPFVLPELEAPA